MVLRKHTLPVSTLLCKPVSVHSISTCNTAYHIVYYSNMWGFNSVLKYIKTRTSTWLNTPTTP